MREPDPHNGMPVNRECTPSQLGRRVALNQGRQHAPRGFLVAQRRVCALWGDAFFAKPLGLHLAGFHWGISHYIGSQLRQCVLDPDGVTLYAYKYRRKVPPFGRRLPEEPPEQGAGTAATAVTGSSSSPD